MSSVTESTASGRRHAVHARAPGWPGRPSNHALLMSPTATAQVQVDEVEARVAMAGSGGQPLVKSRSRSNFSRSCAARCARWWRLLPHDQPVDASRLSLERTARSRPPTTPAGSTANRSSRPPASTVDVGASTYSPCPDSPPNAVPPCWRRFAQVGRETGAERRERAWRRAKPRNSAGAAPAVAQAWRHLHRWEERISSRPGSGSGGAEPEQWEAVGAGAGVRNRGVWRRVTGSFSGGQRAMVALHWPPFLRRETPARLRRSCRSQTGSVRDSSPTRPSGSVRGRRASKCTSA